jgi:hypothetical protein
MYYSPTNAYCGPDPNYRAPQQTPQQPAAVWQDRYGAIFVDMPKGALGTSSSKSNRYAAEQSALADCTARGGINCGKVTSYRNACAVFAIGDAGYTSASREALDEASRISMNDCKAANYGNCRVYYTDCSLPVRTR